MKNLIQERPAEKLEGRLKKTVQFVDAYDITNKSVVDIGCGYGWFELFALKKNVKKILGVEISNEDLKTIKKHINNKKFEALVGTAGKIPANKETFDTIVAWEVIEHIPTNTEDKMFKEVNRVLKKNGAFYLSTPHSAFLSKYLDPAFWLVGHRHYSLKNLVEYGVENNFLVEKVEIVGNFWTVISLINMYIAKWIFRRERFFNNFFNKKDTEGYNRKGFYNIFIKYRKK